MDTELRRRILETVAATAKAKPGGFELPAIDGARRSEVQAIVDELNAGGCLMGGYISPSLNPVFDGFHPSGLTSKGAVLLQEVTAHCQTCGAGPMRIVDESVRAGSGSFDDGSWQTGRIFACEAHGKWHRVGNSALRRLGE